MFAPPARLWLTCVGSERSMYHKKHAQIKDCSRLARHSTTSSCEDILYSERNERLQLRSPQEQHDHQYSCGLFLWQPEEWQKQEQNDTNKIENCI